MIYINNPTTKFSALILSENEDKDNKAFEIMKNMEQNQVGNVQFYVKDVGAFTGLDKSVENKEKFIVTLCAIKPTQIIIH